MLNNEHTWVNLFVNMTLFRQSFVPAVAPTQVLGAHPAVQQPALAFQPSLQANIQGDQNVHVVSPPGSVQALSPQAHGQYMQAPVQPTESKFVSRSSPPACSIYCSKCSSTSTTRTCKSDTSATVMLSGTPQFELKRCLNY